MRALDIEGLGSLCGADGSQGLRFLRCRVLWLSGMDGFKDGCVRVSACACGSRFQSLERSGFMYFTQVLHRATWLGCEALSEGEDCSA